MRRVRGDTDTDTDEGEGEGEGKEGRIGKQMYTPDIRL
jgi:hypothetical protein